MNAKLSKRTASQATSARLAKVISQVGAEAMQPASTVIALPWATTVLNDSRVNIIAILKAASSNGMPGFDYGPVGLTLLRWITINRLAKMMDPSAAVAAALNQQPVPDAVPSKVKPLGKLATPVAPQPTQAAPTVAPATPAAPAPAAPSVAPIQPPPAPFSEEAKAIVEEALAAAPDVVHAASAKTPYVSPAEVAHPEWNWQPASKVFGVKGLRGNVAVWPRSGEPGAHPKVNEVDPDYQWPADHLQWAVFSAGELPAKGMWFWGNRGSGKTEFITQFAARTGRPFFKVTFAATMEPSEFIGDMGASGGASVWQDGTMLQALREPLPSVILLDEISYAQSSHVSGPLNEIIHPQCSYNVPRTGDRIRFSKSHLFCAADNTNGTGDTTNLYDGAKMLNRATMDRFAYFNRFTYLPKSLEVKLIMSKAKCEQTVAEKVWGLLHALRAKVDSGQLNDPPSIREALAMASAMRSGLFDDKDCYERAFVSKYPDDIQEDVRVTFTAVFNAAP